MRRILMLSSAFFVLHLHARCQDFAAKTSRAVPGASWSRVAALPAMTRVHVSTDHGGKNCRVYAVSDDALTCARGSAAGTVMQRTDIRQVKLTHYGRSTLVGAALGGGVGALAGGVAGRTKPCASNPCFNNLGIGAGGVAAIFGVAGAVVGSAVGGLTDMARGSAIYTR